MPRANNPFEFFERVPHGAILEVTVESDDLVQNDVLVVSSGSDDEQWGNAEVLNRTQEKELISQGYIVRLSTTAQGQATGTVKIGIRDHSKPWTWTFDLAAGQGHLCGVFIKMSR